MKIMQILKFFLYFEIITDLEGSTKACKEGPEQPSPSFSQWEHLTLL